MHKKSFLFGLILLVSSNIIHSQNNNRINKISLELDAISEQIPNLNKEINFSITSTSISELLKAIAKSNNLNISSEASLNDIQISQTFSNVTTKNILLYLCKQFNLTVEAIGDIILVRSYKKPYQAREINLKFNKEKNQVSFDLKNDSLSVVFKKITDVTGKNLIYQLGLSNYKLSGYIKEMSLESALDRIAVTNGLKVSKKNDGTFFFEQNRVRRNKAFSKNNKEGFFFKIIDTTNLKLEVDFFNAPIKSIIEEIAYDLKINLATSNPLKEIGRITIKSDSISFQNLVSKLLQDTKYSISFSDGIYFFGLKKNYSVKQTVTIPLKSRSIEMMLEPMERGLRDNAPFVPQQNIIAGNNTSNGLSSGFGNRRNINTTGSRRPFNENGTKAEALLDIMPKEVTDSLSISADVELNSFIVSGDAIRIQRFREFLKKIDKPVPVILIEVMIVEVNKTNSVSAGLDLGVGDTPVSDNGAILSDNATDITLGPESINRLIGGLNGFGSFNLGKVSSNFYARIQALEVNGDLTVKSTPKLSTLNGHEAILSNGVRDYYVVRQVNTIGSINSQVVSTENYVPIDADLSIRIRPFVSQDGNITISLSVLQSSFNSNRIAADAPPGINSREFTSTVRVKDKDVIVLGGLEENLDSESGRGIPFLARIPVIKWLFSKRVREKSNSKLSVFIKPTIIR